MSDWLNIGLNTLFASSLETSSSFSCSSFLSTAPWECNSLENLVSHTFSHTQLVPYWPDYRTTSMTAPSAQTLQITRKNWRKVLSSFCPKFRLQVKFLPDPQIEELHQWPRQKQSRGDTELVYCCNPTHKIRTCAQLCFFFKQKYCLFCFIMEP